MNIFRLSRGGQYSFKGHVIKFPQDVAQFVTELPKRIDQIDTLVLRCPNNNPNLPPHLFTVNRRVCDALSWLQRNSRYYHDNQVNLNALPENDAIQLQAAHLVDD